MTLSALLEDAAVIGGHDGLRVCRTPQGVLKYVCDIGAKAGEWREMNMNGIRNEARFLRLLEGCAYTPRLLGEGDGWLLEEDVGRAEPPTVIQPLMRHCCRMLNAFREKGVRHIDLTWPNVVVVGNHPWAVDWQQSRMVDQEPNPQERWETDSATLWQWLCQLKDGRGINDESRMIRRWGSILSGLGAWNVRLSPLARQTFLDLGCFQGDHVAMARCEGMEAEGVDYGGFRTGEDSIEIAERLWRGMGCKFTKADIFDLPVGYFRRDVVVMFSTFAWMAQQRGGEAAKAVVERIIKEAGVLFFESQLAGDGPGPSWLPNDNHVRGMLRCLGAKAVKSLVTVPVYGRPASRTVWEVRK